MRNTFAKVMSQLKVPIIQAPMAGGINNVTFAVAFGNAGGVGSFGFAYNKVTDIEQALKEVKEKTDAPINANFFVFPSVVNPTDIEKTSAIEALSKRVQFEGAKPPSSPYCPDLETSLEPVWRERPALLTFHFGIPSPHIVSTAKDLGILVGMTATSPEDALEIVAEGADFVIAQGIQAGGHRGYLYTVGGVDRDVERLHREDSALGTAELVRGMVRAGVVIPIVAAGGIMCGADIRAMLGVGATAVQMGTAFLSCDESTASAAHKRYLLNEKDRGSVYTSAFSGRRAQAIRNKFISAMTEGGADSAGPASLLPFPAQNTLTGQMRRQAVQADDGELQSLYAGANYPQCRQLSTAQLMAELKRELDDSAAQ